MACDWRKKKWYNWGTGHCYHRVGSERKVKSLVNDMCAATKDPYTCYDLEKGKSFINTIIDIECCWCGKMSAMKLVNYDIEKASKYPEHKDGDDKLD